MKNKKNLIIIIGVVVVLIVIGILLFCKGNKGDKKVPSLIEEAANNSGKKVSDYKKFQGGEVLNENSYFNEYTFISNNKAYIFDPAKLKTGELSYKKVYDIPDNLKIINITRLIYYFFKYIILYTFMKIFTYHMIKLFR